MSVNITFAPKDKGYDLQVTTLANSGTARDLTAYVGTFQCWRPTTPDTIVASIVGATSSVEGVWHFILSTAFSSGQHYEGSLVMTKAGLQETVENFLVTIPGATYCSLAELKNELNIAGSEHDYQLQSILQQVQTFIDQYCGRSFTTTATVRYFDGSDDTLWIDDATAITSVRLDEDADGTWSSTMACTGSTAAWPTTAIQRDYIAKPYNTSPKTELVLSSNSQYGSFCRGIRQGCMVTGTWGYDTLIPEDVRRAAIIQCRRFYSRGDFAVSGPNELGVVQVNAGLDPDVKMILAPYMRTQYAR